MGCLNFPFSFTGGKYIYSVCRLVLERDISLKLRVRMGERNNFPYGVNLQILRASPSAFSSNHPGFLCLKPHQYRSEQNLRHVGLAMADAARRGFGLPHFPSSTCCLLLHGRHGGAVPRLFKRSSAVRSRRTVLVGSSLMWCSKAVVPAAAHPQWRRVGTVFSHVFWPCIARIKNWQKWPQFCRGVFVPTGPPFFVRGFWSFSSRCQRTACRKPSGGPEGAPAERAARPSLPLRSAHGPSGPAAGTIARSS